MSRLKIDEAAKGGLTIFWELFTVIPFCTELNLLTPFFIPLYDNGSPYISDSQVGYSAGGYSLSSR